MPALVWFRRTWRTGTDDFTFSSTLYFALLMLSGGFILSRTEYGTGNARMRTSLPDCPDASATLVNAFSLLGVTNIIQACVFAMTAALSLRGAVFESSKRSQVPFFLYIDLAGIALSVILTCLCVKTVLFDGEARHCRSRGSLHVFHLAFILNAVVAVLFSLSMLVAFDPSGRRQYHSPDEYADKWTRRCRLLCCTCTERKPQSDDAFRSVAQVLAASFRGYDIVPSDIAAGVLLLHGYQETSRWAMADRVVFDVPPDSRAERVASQARVMLRLTDAEKNLVRDLDRYSVFFMAAYGWMLHEYTHCCTGMPRLCCFDPFMMCRAHPGKSYGSGCYCDMTTLLKETAVPEEDVLLTSWTNDIFKPVHYALYDRNTDAVVIAVRGTMSFTDCLTDLSAAPEHIPLHDRSPRRVSSEFYVHGGMYRSAQYVYRSLEYNGVLHSVLEGRLAQKKVVLVGHSLGAGVALILSTMLWSAFPEMRERLLCLAYAPPGGTMSEAVVEYCKDFTVGAFMGYDMIPRFAQHTFDTFRESLFDVLEASPMPKSLLFLNALRTDKVAQRFHPATRHDAKRDKYRGDTLHAPSTESREYRDAMRRAPCTPQHGPRKLYPCARIVHFRKVVVRASTGCGGMCACCYTDPVYAPCMEGHEEQQVIEAAPSMFGDHFPDKLFATMRISRQLMDSGALDRFYVDTPDEVAAARREEASIAVVRIQPSIIDNDYGTAM